MYATELTVVGTLITAIGKRRLPDGTTVVSFRVASNERRFDRAADTWTDGDTFYVSVTAWRKLAENVHASFVVGDPIIVRGRIFSRSYDKDGRRQSVTELEAAAVGPDLARSTAVVTRTRRADAPANGSSGPADRSGTELDRDDPWMSGMSSSGPADQTVAAPDDPSAVASGELRGEAVEAAVGA
jgi:Single-stranded DNA-binding protein